MDSMFLLLRDKKYEASVCVILSSYLAWFDKDLSAIVKQDVLAHSTLLMYFAWSSVIC